MLRMLLFQQNMTTTSSALAKLYVHCSLFSRAASTGAAYRKRVALDADSLKICAEEVRGIIEIHVDLCTLHLRLQLMAGVWLQEQKDPINTTVRLNMSHFIIA